MREAAGAGRLSPIAQNVHRLCCDVTMIPVNSVGQTLIFEHRIAFIECLSKSSGRGADEYRYRQNNLLEYCD